MNYLLATGIAILLGFTIFVSLRRKRLIYSTVALAVVGIVLVSSTFIPWLPYTNTETVRNDVATNLAPSFRTFGGETPVSTNGSFSVISLLPNSGKTFTSDSALIQPAANTSIIQIEISTSAPLEVSIGELNNVLRIVPDNIYFNQTVGSPTSFGSPDNWITFYCTPSGLQSERTTAFLFQNPNNQSLQFSFNVTDFNLEHTDIIETQKYRPLLGTYYAYVGISLMILAVALNVVSYLWVSHTSLRRLQEASE